MIHELKTTPEYFKDIAEGVKTFEVRKDDRGFSVGDFLALNEYDKDEPPAMEYTGNCMFVRITYILRNNEYCKDGYCVMGIMPCYMRDPYSFIRENNPSFEYGKNQMVYDRNMK